VIDILVIAVIGGLRRPIGPVHRRVDLCAAAHLLTRCPDAVGLSGERFKLLIGLGFLAIVFFSPDGVLGLWERWRAAQGAAWRSLTGERRE
jgi:branched-chain amino acid transport system permease protein